jgi:hypothetical protein
MMVNEKSVKFLKVEVMAVFLIQSKRAPQAR